MSTAMNWFAAKALAYSGKAIRRASWSKWLVRGISLWDIVVYDTSGNASSFVARNSDIAAVDLMANDWTTDVFNSTYVTPQGIAGTMQVGAASFGTVTNPPDPSSLFQPQVATVGAETPRPIYTNTPPSGEIPVINALLLGYGVLNAHTTVNVRVAVTGGPPSTGVYLVYLNGTYWQTDAAWIGLDTIISFNNIVIDPGSTIQLYAEYQTGLLTYSSTARFDIAEEPPVTLLGNKLPELIDSLA